jgi:hypothetical protein
MTSNGAMQVNGIVDPAIGGRQDEGLAFQIVGNMANECLIEDGI